MIYISFVVDNLEEHYYQAELLLYSIECNTKLKKENIIVQCLSRVDKCFLDYLKENGYAYNIIEPYLDGKYCNKLQQLDYFLDKKISSVILLDTDMFVLNDISLLNSDSIMAKIVDAPNPSIKTLKNIYQEASLELPLVVSSDWNSVNNQTFENNFNGGFYYIPSKFIPLIAQEWKNWAKWLYGRKELFENQNQFIHVDQISFSLAVQANNLSYKKLVANYNYPIHNNLELKSYNLEDDIHILHYHRELNQFGLISEDKVSNKKVINSIDKANNIILEKENIVFFKYYKKKSISKLNENSNSSFESKIKNIVSLEDKFKLILHAGTPKTGTTSLQKFFASNGDLINKHGYLYPNNYSKNGVPKHQWIVSCLLADDFKSLFLHIQEACEEAKQKNINKIILSTEGIYNHWNDYSKNAKNALAILSKYFDITLLIVFREPVSFMMSLYKQNLKNPKMDLVDCYGKDLSFSEMLKDEWFLSHLDYLGFLYDIEELLGKNNIQILQYNKNMVKTICEELKINCVNKEKVFENISHINQSIKILRVINRYNLTNKNKKYILSMLFPIDNILNKYFIDDTLIEKEKQNIKKLFCLQSKILENEFGIKFDD